MQVPSLDVLQPHPSSISSMPPLSKPHYHAHEPQTPLHRTPRPSSLAFTSPTSTQQHPPPPFPPPPQHTGTQIIKTPSLTPKFSPLCNRYLTSRPYRAADVQKNVAIGPRATRATLCLGECGGAHMRAVPYARNQGRAGFGNVNDGDGL